MGVSWFHVGVSELPGCLLCKLRGDDSLDRRKDEPSFRGHKTRVERSNVELPLRPGHWRIRCRLSITLAAREGHLAEKMGIDMHGFAESYVKYIYQR